MTLTFINQPSVAGTDSVKSIAPRTRQEPAALIVGGGDVALLLTFAVIGRWNHHELSTGGLAAILGTAAPFVAGWAGAASLLGTYHRGSLASVRSSIERLLVTWPVALAVGLCIRSIADGEIPAAALMVVALMFNLLTLSVWRVLAVTWLQMRQRRAL